MWYKDPSLRGSTVLYIILFPISSALHAENCRLREEDLRLKAEVQRLTQQNTDLSQVRDHQSQWKDCFMDPFSPLYRR